MYSFRTQNGYLHICPVRENILRCVYTAQNTVAPPSDWVSSDGQEAISCHVSEQTGSAVVETARVRATLDLGSAAIRFEDRQTGRLYLQEQGKHLEPQPVIRYTTNGEPPVIERVKTVDGERNFVKNLSPRTDRTAFRAKLFFRWQPGESIHGLGQGEEGIYNYRGHVQYLYQHNMRIPIPFLVSSQGYAILADCGSLMTFNDDERGSYLLLDTVDQLDYYFIAGTCIDELIDGYRTLTGKARLLPLWAYGYVQSKEAYTTADELEETVRRYRQLGIPLDCIVQDWNTWEAGQWGQKTVDKTRYPDLAGTLARIHAMQAHALVSVWPNMNAGCPDHTEMAEKGFLLNDYATYDAFSRDARALYWEQCRKELFAAGFDGWWCDSTEPFSGPDWGGQFMKEPWERYRLVGDEHKRYLDPGKANLYALYHAKGMFENQRREAPEKRMLNLTRSGYAGSQKYGTVLWSGDISANWACLKRQITEGLNVALSGISHWTLDAGGFFVVGSAWWKRGCGCHTNPNPLWFWKGEYNEGVQDPAYRELYVRWLEYAAFLPMFRSHGTDTPREIWHFGREGEPFYDAVAQTIRLRYQLLPYVYSLAGQSYLHNRTMLRSLLFDFPEDPRAASEAQEFLFGQAFLVCPVTEPLYSGAPEGAPVQEKNWRVYLPAGCLWHDFWTGKVHSGGQELYVNAPLDRIPVFVRAGSVVPMAGGLESAAQLAGAELELHLFDGADGEFLLYEDEGDGCAYEKGGYSLIPLQWNEQTRTLTIGMRTGSFAGMREKRTFRVFWKGNSVLLEYTGQPVRLVCP